MNAQYRAMVLQRPTKVVEEPRTRGELAPWEVELRIKKAGICGTDLAIYSGAYRVPLPLVLGHEFVGEIARLGSEVEGWKEGERVVAEINNHCIAQRKTALCPHCASGMPTHCRERTVLGIFGADGAFSEYLKVPAGNLHRLPESIPDRAGVIVEPLAAALQTFAFHPIKGGELVVILGSGRLGSLIVFVAKALGATVVAISRSEERRKLASIFGADYTFPPSEQLPAQIRELRAGLGADAVVDSTGDPEACDLALSLLRPRGRLYLKTTSGIPSTLNQTQIVVDEIQISATRCGDFSKAIRFLTENQLPIDRWISSEFPLRKLSRALERAKAPGKILIDIAN